MSFLFAFLSRCAFILAATSLVGEEWKKEVQNCGDQMCFVLQGEEKAVLLGSLTWAKEAVPGGKEMRSERYFYEGISLVDKSGNEMHIYGLVLEKAGQEWANSTAKVSFNEYVLAKEEWDAEFAKMIDTEKVRYFSDEEREQTRVHFVNGALWQIGLDGERNEIAQVPEGGYAFVLGNEQLYLTPKIVTKKGKIQHSSFFRGGPVRAAGKMQVGPDGRIVWLSDDSGHYRPSHSATAEALQFFHSQMPTGFFEKIWVRIKPDEAWEDPASFMDYDASEVDKESDVPVKKWLAPFLQKK